MVLYFRKLNKYKSIEIEIAINKNKKNGYRNYIEFLLNFKGCKFIRNLFKKRIKNHNFESLKKCKE